ncbi:hypothetical protein [Geomonas oryzae]|uniref:hypothetical protein n=1 Tax=Geomonas oryzae TaxID=2364273 RepID=UPI00100B781E|nr:hypothetical protein [Geomonas oryzae]
MQDFLKNITSTSWWVGVVIVGIVINLVSSYLKPYLDEQMSKMSASKKALLDMKSQELKLLVLSIQNDKHTYIVESFNDLRHRNRALALFIMSVLLFALSQQLKANPALYTRPFNINLELLFSIVDTITMLMASICMMLGINHYKIANYITRALNQARKS